MNESKLEDIAFKLNCYETPTGTTFATEVSEDGDTVAVTCSNNPEFPIVLAKTDTQILSVCPLFTLDDVEQSNHAELNKVLLQLSPVVPLSSFGYQGDSIILYGAMAVSTLFENIAHELEVQANNTLDVLESLTEFLK
ncbi:YjfI family protein [Agarilytica rhodophyticola]|uniref:YjfI family protein n=1 Tax=Agarilytica rhodophyticola TaxID=1737490 RepID=UPI000B347D7B|nr:DUF2170 family protein [Agarilytica rhodophyticola]